MRLGGRNELPYPAEASPARRCGATQTLARRRGGLPAPVGGTQSNPSGNASIRGKAGSSEVVITTTDRLAGAIHSVQWRGKEFIESHDHGRQPQSAASFDCAASSEFWAECFNPTEAGSARTAPGTSLRAS
jgi:hypothetical protein